MIQGEGEGGGQREREGERECVCGAGGTVVTYVLQLGEACIMIQRACQLASLRWDAELLALTHRLYEYCHFKDVAVNLYGNKNDYTFMMKKNIA